jgi:uncharacterized protein YndB with AHSA1/START domain
MRRQCEAEIVVKSAPEAVWAVVSDVTRVGEWSGECRGCAWTGEPARAEPGARFRGKNRRGGYRWSRLNEIVVADVPKKLVWRTVPAGIYPDSVEWQIDIVPDGDVTRVKESYSVLKIPKLMEMGISVALPAHRDRTSDLHSDLERLKRLVESEGASSLP